MQSSTEITKRCPTGHPRARSSCACIICFGVQALLVCRWFLEQAWRGRLWRRSHVLRTGPTLLVVLPEPDSLRLKASGLFHSSAVRVHFFRTLAAATTTETKEHWARDCSKLLQSLTMRAVPPLELWKRCWERCFRIYAEINSGSELPKMPSLRSTGEVT